ncbi:MAG: SDR family NAD(P)-dependent oxidoreductase [Parasphingorhabdus sp.]
MFKDKVVWITGASSGIGEAFADAFHAQGAHVILSALSQEELEPVTSRLDGAVSLAFDVADFEALPALADQAMGHFGRIDILVNNAGITQRALAKDTSFEVYRRVIDVDLMAPIALTQLVLPHMRARGSGRILVMGSVAGKFGSALRTAYCAAKHGVFGYFDALRAEVVHDGIEVHVIAPGAVRTNLARNALTGGGDRFGRTDDFIEGGYDPAYLVSEVFKAIAKGRREIIIARGKERLGYRLRRFFPETAFDVIAKATPVAIEKLRRLN